ncbi:MAG: C40 family peptidase [Saprospiraceae bacterium]|nr:C40 family peptidase [Candidatus Vicinibacter affinis]MBK9961988.1 C40 family peptidase [Candidatus Vicinibacter affinis]
MNFVPFFSRILRITLLAIVLMSFQSCASASRDTLSQNKVNQDSLDKGFRNEVLSVARSLKGKKYKSGGKNPKGFDCSGFVIYVLDKVGVQMASCSADQSKCGRTIKVDNAKPGDLIYFGTKGRINHVGIITENSKNKLMIIHSSSSQGVVEENILQYDYWLKRIRMAKDLNSFPREKSISLN